MSQSVREHVRRQGVGGECGEAQIVSTFSGKKTFSAKILGGAAGSQAESTVAPGGIVVSQHRHISRTSICLAKQCKQPSGSCQSSTDANITA